MLMTNMVDHAASRSKSWSDGGKETNEGTLLTHLIETKSILAADSYTLQSSPATDASMTSWPLPPFLKPESNAFEKHLLLGDVGLLFTCSDIDRIRLRAHHSERTMVKSSTKRCQISAERSFQRTVIKKNPVIFYDFKNVVQ